jgi:glycosyltransferase 2 family protein
MKQVTKMRGFFKACSLLLLSIPLFWWAIRDIPITNILATLRSVNPAALIFLSLVNLLILLLFTGRWWLVMRALGQKLPFQSLVVYRLAGFGVSYFTPGPQIGGEPLQVHLIHKNHHLAGGVALAGVSVDKLIEMLINFSFLVFGLLLVIRTQLLSISELSLLLPVGLLAIPVLYLSLMRIGRRPVSSLLIRLSFIENWVPSYTAIRHHVHSAEDQVASFVSGNLQFLFGTLALSIITWAVLIFEYWLTLSLFGIHLEAAQVIIALTAARIAFLMPVPAGLGALEAAQVAAMQLLGLEPVLGLSVSLIIRARDFTLGSLGLWMGGFSVHRSRNISGVQTIPIALERREKA